MFEKGDVISVSKKGICEVLDIKKNAFIGCDKDREYYVLKPIDMINNMVVYVPVNSTLAMRKILTSVEAKNVLKTKINNIKTIEFSQDEISKIIIDGKFDEWLLALKFLTEKKKTASKKMFALQDQKQLDTLVGLVATELAITLKIDIEEMKTKILENLN